MKHSLLFILTMILTGCLLPPPQVALPAAPVVEIPAPKPVVPPLNLFCNPYISGDDLVKEPIKCEPISGCGVDGDSDFNSRCQNVI